MLNEFYEYISEAIIRFFQQKGAALRAGERFCLTVDTEEMAEGIYEALDQKTSQQSIQGQYHYKSVYDTFTIRVNPDREVVVAARIHGMTDDFLATLRNASLTDKHFPILMITNSPIDSILSGTANLLSRGMPFHAETLRQEIKSQMETSELKPLDKAILEKELENKQRDRFVDKSSLYEYSNILSVLKRGFMKATDYPGFALIFDPDGDNVPAKSLPARIEANRRHFETIDFVFHHGNIDDGLAKKYDKALILELKKKKQEGKEWWIDLTYEKVKRSEDKQNEKQDNPLIINEGSISVFSGSPLEYSFELNTSFFIRNERSKGRLKNILVYNASNRSNITLSVIANKTMARNWIAMKNGSKYDVMGKTLSVELLAGNCVFEQITIDDPNSPAKYILRVCILDIATQFLKEIQTAYTITVSSASKCKINVYGVKDLLRINPDQENVIEEELEDGKVYDCPLNQELRLKMTDNSIDYDQGFSNITVRCGAVSVPLHIVDEESKTKPISGKAVFTLKHRQKKGLEYRNERIIDGTQEYYVKDREYKEDLLLESKMLDNGWLAMERTIEGGDIEYKLDVSESVVAAYHNLSRAIREMRQLPSLMYYSDTIVALAKLYVNAVMHELDQIKEGSLTLTAKQNHLLLLGSVMDFRGDSIIKLSPLHPLNVQYQLFLREETNVGDVRENLVERLSPLFLLPYFRDPMQRVYHAVEQEHSPEWCNYALLTNKRYLGARNFVSKLVASKIEHYSKHFPFLFKDLGNYCFAINLISMGDCKEVLEGLAEYYAKHFESDGPFNTLMEFVINIYDEHNAYNVFSLLADQRKLRGFLNGCSLPNDVDINDLTQVITRNVKCYFRNPNEEEYQYAHISFYEMPTDEVGKGRAEEIITGTALCGLTSGIPSVFDNNWYKTGYGAKYAYQNDLTRLAMALNAVATVAFTGSSYEPNTCIFTVLKGGQEGILGKIYDSSNWVVFVEPKVDLRFFQTGENEDDLMIIHYSDQYTSASGYDDITVTRKSKQYIDIIFEHLKEKGVTATRKDINSIISLFNAVNGSWMLKLISTKKLTGAVDSNFSREKMSILSAIKICMAYYAHKNIIWVPISLDEMLRISGGVGLSQNDGILSGKNLGFEKGPACDDILMVGIEGPAENIKVYLHPVEVKIGLNDQSVIAKAHVQVLKTYNGLMNALWPEDEEKRNTLECKLSRSFLMQLVVVCCEKMQLYNIYPDEEWEKVLGDYRMELTNEQYTISDRVNPYIGKGTIISFRTDAINEEGHMDDDVCVLEFPEKKGSEYMVSPASMIEKMLRIERRELPPALTKLYDGDTERVQDHDGVANNQRCIEPEEDNESTCEQTVEHNADMFTEEQQDKEGQRTEGVLDEPQIEDVDRRSMNIMFGTDLSTGEPLYWYPNDTSLVFHTNTGIIGTMGTGKTQFTQSLITQLYLEQKYNYDGHPLGILIFDYKGDYNRSKENFSRATNTKVYAPYHLPFNPLTLTRSAIEKPLLPIHTANAFKATLSKAFNLGPKQESTLNACIIQAYQRCGIIPGNPSTWGNVAPTFNDVYDCYAQDDSIKKNDSLAAVMEKLQQFEVFEPDPTKTISLFDLLDGVVVIDLSGYDSDIQSLIVAITLDLFYVQMQAAGSSKSDERYRQLTKIIMVDEADNFMSEGFPSLKKILKEGREFGVGTILSTQFLKHFGSGDDDYAKYILSWVVHNVADLKPSDVEFVFKTEAKSATTMKLFNDIKSLKKHQSVVKIGNKPPQYIEDRAFWRLYKELFNKE